MIFSLNTYEMLYCKGFSPEEALKKQVDLESATKKSTERKVRLDSGALQNLKHDVNALKQFADLRQKTQATASGWQGGVVAERREGDKLYTHRYTYKCTTLNLQHCIDI